MANDYPKVIQGDSRRLQDFLPANSVDLVVSGPPYWNEVVYSSDDGQLSKIEDYNLFLKEIGAVWQSCFEVLKPGAILAFWMHDFYREDSLSQKVYVPFHADLLKTMPENFVFRNVLIWDRYLSRRKDYYPAEAALGTKMQYILIFQKPGRGENQELIQDSLVKNFWNPVWKKKTHPKLLGSKVLFRTAFGIGKYFSFLDLVLDPVRAVLNKTAVQDKYSFKNYLTEDPEEIIHRLIEDYSSEGNIVLDPFMGSATVLKVAEKLGRFGVGVDVNPEAIVAAKKKLNSVLK
jgi:DNA modification methylase